VGGGRGGGRRATAAKGRNVAVGNGRRLRLLALLAAVCGALGYWLGAAAIK